MTDDTTRAPTVISEEDRNLLLSTWQDTQRNYDDVRCLHAQFSAKAAEHPEKTALIYRDRSITYRGLDELSNQIARSLLAKGVGVETLVGICVDRSIEMVAGLFGILKAGAAYVPLDPAYPQERLAVMLEDSGARVLVTQENVLNRLPKRNLELVLMDSEECKSQSTNALEDTGVQSSNLAYVIFTSGSTGRPKGVMVQHNNVSNFFAGMDEAIGTEPGTWLAVTSISFDISVLEIFWTLCRGFTVVIQEESDRASLSRTVGSSSKGSMGFGMFYFASQSTTTSAAGSYHLMMEGAKFADAHGFEAVWTPERHFHEFGGIYPNPAVTTAALAAVTDKVHLRAGSVVLPLHDPIRVAEDWAVVDNLSQGRVGLSFASGWHANDFALMPQNYEGRRDVMMKSIATIRKLWKGEKIPAKNGEGKDIEICIFPRPVQDNPPIWIATAGTPETFAKAGANGFNILTNMLGQDIQALERNFAAYKEARKNAGFEDDGIISVMLHTFVCDDDEKARQLAKAPFCNYMATSYDLVKVAPWMFPAFKQPSSKKEGAFDAESFNAEDQAALLEHAFDRYFDTAGLFGSPRRALKMIDRLKKIGATEVACLIDFGVDPDVVVANLPYLAELRRLSNPGESADIIEEDYSISAQIERHGVTHFQCTPSMARMIVAQGGTAALGQVEHLLLGGEALPVDLAQTLTTGLKGRLLNMYGPTESTIWSTTNTIAPNSQSITIGRPIANTSIRILDPDGNLVPVGQEGELCIGGAGVVRGYFGRDDLTQERFISDPFSEGQRLYRTGDLARYLPDGQLEFLGRLDQQIKLNGYRIEMGEIEAVLTRHPGVQEAVVVARQERGEGRLAAYIIPSSESADSATKLVRDEDRVASWGQQWSEAYGSRVGASNAEVRFDTSGWLDSFTGEILPQDQMRNWRDEIVTSILAIEPRRILEIGCGTGMILFGCLEKVESYTGVEISAEAIAGISEKLSEKEKTKVQLLEGAADALDKLNLGDFDLVVINSVAQYFPNQEYLTRVLQKVASLTVDGGHLFIGDLRSFEHLREFHAEVELHQAPDGESATALGSNTSERVAAETELLVSRDYFSDLVFAEERLNIERMQLRQSADSNEMTRYRFDVLLKVGSQGSEAVGLPPSMQGVHSLDDLKSSLKDEPSLLFVEALKNSRLDAIERAMEQMSQGNGDAAQLRELLLEPASGIEPSAVFALDPRYEVELRFGKQPGTFDALFRHKETAPAGVWALPRKSSSAATTNVPAVLDAKKVSVPEMRRHIRHVLPEYMLPHDYVFMEVFPLTPNGKIDRKSLPDPRSANGQNKEVVLPQGEIESVVAEIWKELLGIDQVSTQDNIFDIGASSLLTVEANSRLSEKLGRKIPLVNMFRYPTIAKLAAHLGGESTKTSETQAAATSDRDDRRKAAAERRRQARAARQSS